jgi:hypothetical protein
MNETDERELVHFWRQCVGLEPPDPESWQMYAGSHMESAILDWREKETGQKITERGVIIDHPLHPTTICTKLDGYRAADDCVVEAKFLSAFRHREEFRSWYYPQVLLQMLCRGAAKGVLVVAQGNADPVEHEIYRDAAYEAEMMARIAAFLICIRTFTPPCVLPRIIPPEKWRTVDLAMDATNWGAELEQHLQDYAATAEAAEQHEAAGKAARALVPDDVGKVLTGPWKLARNKNGVVSITTRRTA